jgi:hypothetical protein
MTIGDIIVTIIAALIGASAGAFTFAQFMIKRKDEKEEKDIQKLIDDKVKEAMDKVIANCGEIGDKAIQEAIQQTRNEVHQEIEDGLTMRGEEGRKRFEINSEQIQQNTAMIKEVLTIQKETNEKFDKLAESMTILNEAVAANAGMTKACAEGNRSMTYDRILLVANKALKRGAITISEKTNLKQLYASWQELQGEDPKITTLCEDCFKLKSIPDEEEN